MITRNTVRRLSAMAAVLAACVVAGTAVGDDSGSKADEAKPPREIKSFGDAEKDLKRLAIAMHNYESTYGRLPPAAVRDKNGKSLLSWRVLMLPYVDQNVLYKQFKHDEAWDSPHNKKLIAKMPVLFRGPNKKLNDEGKTVYLAPLDTSTVFPPDGSRVRFANIYDGLSNTVLFVEVNDESAVVWTKPDDLVVDMKKPMKPITELVRREQEFFLAAMCDGSVRRFKNVTRPNDLVNLARVFDRQDGEVIDYSTIEWKGK
jgi:hypothetical protein